MLPGSALLECFTVLQCAVFYQETHIFGEGNDFSFLCTREIISLARNLQFRHRGFKFVWGISEIHGAATVGRFVLKDLGTKFLRAFGPQKFRGAQLGTRSGHFSGGLRPPEKLPSLSHFMLCDSP